MTQQSPYEDIDPVETQEWLESIESVMRAQGPERAHFLLEKLVDFTRRSGAYLPFKPNTAYLNTISRAQEPDYPGDRSLERRNEAYMRWNALAMVVQANHASSEYGGHIASFAQENPRVPVMLHFGRQDEHIPATEVAKVQTAHPEVEIYWYDAGHGFNCDMRGSYNEKAAKEAMPRTLEFFNKHL